MVSDGQRCVMACDSQAKIYGKKVTLAKPKVFAKDGVLVAGAGHGPLLMEWCARRITIETEAPLVEFARFISDEFRIWCKERDQLEKQPDDQLDMPCTMLIAKGPDFVQVDGNGGLVHVAEKWHAIGSGAPEARGAMFVASRSSEDGRDGSVYSVGSIAKLGVMAACAFDDGCSGPVHVMWTQP